MARERLKPMQGALQLASKRRKTRLVYSREANGRIQREYETAPTAVKRLRDAALCGMQDPEWGTELGRLFLQNTITPAMYAAGKRWSELASKYQKSIGVFPVRSLGAEPVSRSMSPDPDSDDGRRIAEREANNAEKFFEAHSHLVMAGCLAEAGVRRLCEHNEAPIGFGELSAVRTGLMRLVSHWGMVGERG